MEQSRNRELSPFVDRWLDVQARIEYDGTTPAHVVFAYLEKGQLKGGTIAIGPDFDTNQIYGGLMAWTGRYEAATCKLVAVQISNAGSWHTLGT